ncbi:hypothetical protein CCAN12_600028 [Capnocytophaga canimorsus]|uniref:Uncharacterized protein n=1 Tax=Capnocytophaga canimorsus TaxID=28188 RepID=A0A0B7H6P9_9FLAO|nr:hypothetical protein CCAN12_600028 [Capnocytophaga canimorsus]
MNQKQNTPTLNLKKVIFIPNFTITPLKNKGYILQFIYFYYFCT